MSIEADTLSSVWKIREDLLEELFSSSSDSNYKGAELRKKPLRHGKQAIGTRKIKFKNKGDSRKGSNMMGYESLAENSLNNTVFSSYCVS